MSCKNLSKQQQGDLRFQALLNPLECRMLCIFCPVFFLLSESQNNKEFWATACLCLAEHRLSVFCHLFPSYHHPKLSSGSSGHLLCLCLAVQLVIKLCYFEGQTKWLNGLVELVRRPCATVSIDWLIKSCYQDGGRPAQPAAFRDVPCCVWVNKVMCSLSGCNTAGVVAMWWLHYRRHFDCQSKRLGPNASQCDEEGPGEEKVPHLPWFIFPERDLPCVQRSCVSLPSFRNWQTEKPQIGRWEHRQHALTAMKEDVWNVGCVSAGAEEGRRLVRESGRGDRRSHYVTPSFL